MSEIPPLPLSLRLKGLAVAAVTVATLTVPGTLGGADVTLESAARRSGRVLGRSELASLTIAEVDSAAWVANAIARVAETGRWDQAVYAAYSASVHAMRGRIDEDALVSTLRAAEREYLKKTQAVPSQSPAAAIRLAYNSIADAQGVDGDALISIRVTLPDIPKTVTSDLRALESSKAVALERAYDFQTRHLGSAYHLGRRTGDKVVNGLLGDAAHFNALTSEAAATILSRNAILRDDPVVQSLVASIASVGGGAKVPVATVIAAAQGTVAAAGNVLGKATALIKSLPAGALTEGIDAELSTAAKNLALETAPARVRASAAVYLAGVIGNAMDPETGKKITAIGTSAFEIASAVDGFVEGLSSASTLGDLASGLFTGDLLGSANSILSAFGQVGLRVTNGYLRKSGRLDSRSPSCEPRCTNGLIASTSGSTISWTQ